MINVCNNNCVYNMIMYVIIGKDNVLFGTLENLLDEKGIRYHDLDMIESPFCREHIL